MLEGREEAVLHLCQKAARLEVILTNLTERGGNKTRRRGKKVEINSSKPEPKSKKKKGILVVDEFWSVGISFLDMLVSVGQRIIRQKP